MKKRHPQSAIATTAKTTVRGLEAANGAPHLALACRLADSNRAQSVAFGTEGGIFQAAGLPTVICGPGSIDQAHQPNEFIDAAQLELGAAFLSRVADELRKKRHPGLVSG